MEQLMRYMRVVLLSVGLFGLAGCGALPMGQPEDRHAIPKPERQYAGLKGQSAAVMVWTDWRTRTEYPRIQLDMARLTQARLEKMYPPVERPSKDDRKQKELVNVVDFINPASVARFQRERPETEGQPIVQVAPRLGVSRVLYIELESFDAHAPQSIMLLKGSARATLRVVEVSPDGLATVAFEESGIEVNFPPNAPEGVIPDENRTVRTIYQGTLDRLAEAVAVRFSEK
jgi:hypothetical protein